MFIVDRNATAALVIGFIAILAYVNIKLEMQDRRKAAADRAELGFPRLHEEMIRTAVGIARTRLEEQAPYRATFSERIVAQALIQLEADRSQTSLRIMT